MADLEPDTKSLGAVSFGVGLAFEVGLEAEGIDVYPHGDVEGRIPLHEHVHRYLLGRAIKAAPPHQAKKVAEHGYGAYQPVRVYETFHLAHRHGLIGGGKAQQLMPRLCLEKFQNSTLRLML